MNDRYEKGIKKQTELFGESVKDYIASLDEIAPDLGKYLVEFVFGDVYSTGNEIDSKEREIIIISCLVTLGAVKQAESHMNAALNVGVPPKKIIRALLQCLPYVGFPRVLDAVAAAKKVFEERKIHI